MADDSVGYFHNVQKWRGSRAVQRMSFTERGVYREMMDEQWDHGPLPDDAQAVADLIAITPEQVQEVLAAWSVVRTKFVSSERRPGRIYNVKLEQTRKEQRAYYRRQRANGRKGGEAKARNTQTPSELSSTTATAPLESALAKSTEKKGKEGSGKDGSGTEKKERPVFRSQRFDLFQWQIDALQQQVGDAFDVPDWLHDLSRRTTHVMPERAAVWPWLQQQAVAEARRRGLAVAEPARVGKQTTNLATALSRIAAES